jgi:hypothetical protein
MPIPRTADFPVVLVIVLFLAAGYAGCASEPAEDATFAAEPFPVLTSESGESWISMNGSGSRMVFGRHDKEWNHHVIWESLRFNGTWQEPEVAPFSGTYNDRGARFYPALDAVVFSSDRPISASDTTDDFNIWITQNDGENWSEPEPMSVLNSDADDIHPSVAADGTIWFSSNRKGSMGGSDLYNARLGAHGYEVRHVPAPVNSEFSEADSFVDPSGRYVIFSRTDDPAGLGGDDLFITLRSRSGWSDPVHLGAVVNTPEYEYGPWVSRDGRFLYFTSHRGGTSDIYRISTDKLPIELPSGGVDDGAPGIELTTPPESRHST